ncbi:MAG TPA: hypothetical protein VGQ22_24470, partial [Steroidobacteraceae bacterium]|nr:hypothetical protein [Steroidobacteraceae bacterium]
MTARAIATRISTAAPSLLLAFAAIVQAQTQVDPKLTEVWEPVPRMVNPGRGTQAPSDALVLFDGKDLSEWESVADG